MYVFSLIHIVNTFFVTLISLFLLQGFKPLSKVVKVDIIIIPRAALRRVPAQRSVTRHHGEVGQVEHIAASGGGGRGRGATGQRRLVRWVVGGRPSGIVQTRVIAVRGMIQGPGPRDLRLRGNVVLERGRDGGSATSDVGILEGLGRRSCEA